MLGFSSLSLATCPSSLLQVEFEPVTHNPSLDCGLKIKTSFTGSETFSVGWVNPRHEKRSAALNTSLPFWLRSGCVSSLHSVPVIRAKWDSSVRGNSGGKRGPVKRCLFVHCSGRWGAWVVFVPLWVRLGAKSRGLFPRITPWCQLSAYKGQLWAGAGLLCCFVDLAFYPALECSPSRKNKSCLFLPEYGFGLTKCHPESSVIRGGCRLEESLPKKLYSLEVDLYKEIFKQCFAFV